METIHLPGKTALNPIEPTRDLETLALPGKPDFASLIDYTPEERARKASVLRSKAAQYREMARSSKLACVIAAYHEEADVAQAEAYRLEIQPPNIAAQVAELWRQARVKRDHAFSLRRDAQFDRDTLLRAAWINLAAQCDLQAADREREAIRLEATQQA